MTIAEIKSEFSKLMPEDQDRLVTELVAMMVPPELPDWHAEELDRRLADPDLLENAILWDEAKRKLGWDG